MSLPRNSIRFLLAVCACACISPAPAATPQSKPVTLYSQVAVQVNVQTASSSYALAGARVNLSNQKTNFVAVSDLRGGAVFGRIPYGGYTVTIAAQGYAPYSGTVLVLTPKRSFQFSVKPATPGNANWRVHVQGKTSADSAATALSGAKVTLKANNQNLAQTTGSDGQAQFQGVPAVVYSVSIKKTGYSELSASVDLRPGENSNTYTLVMGSTGPGSTDASFSAQVLGRNEATGSQTALAGASVGLSSPGHSYNKSTDSGGWARFTGVAAGHYTLTITKSGYVSRSSGIDLSAGENGGDYVLSNDVGVSGSVQNIPKPPEGALAKLLERTRGRGGVRLIDLDGLGISRSLAPVKDAKVVLELQSKTARFIRQATTDGKGGFRFKGIRQGTYWLLISKPGHAAYREPVRVKGSLDSEHIVLLPQGASATPANQGRGEQQPTEAKSDGNLERPFDN